MKIEIKSVSLNPSTTKVLIDGLDISASLRSLDLMIEKDEITVATISIDVHEIDIDAQSLATLQAVLNIKEAKVHDEAAVAAAWVGEQSMVRAVAELLDVRGALHPLRPMDTAKEATS